MAIVKCSNDLMNQAEDLINVVFPSMSFLESLSFLAIRNPKGLLGRVLMSLARVERKITFDVYLDENQTVIGSTGLYTYKKDCDDSVWMAWFCVTPTGRNKGVGQHLMNHTVKMANDKGFSKLKLYTSTDPNEADAQRLYERNGLKETHRKKGLFQTTIFRELKLK